MTLLERLRHHGWSVSNEGCWNFHGTLRCKKGYRLINVGRRPIAAHRASYEVFIGPIPHGLVVRHACDNPSCINPEHLSVGTHQQNADDRSERGRGVKGELTGTAVLTRDAVLTIRRLSANGVPQRTLAAQFGVGRTTIARVVRRETWAHLPEELNTEGATP